MKKRNPKERPLDNVHVYLEMSRRFIFGAKVMPGYEKYQKTAQKAIKAAIKMLTVTSFPQKQCPGWPAVVFLIPPGPLRPLRKK